MRRAGCFWYLDLEKSPIECLIHLSLICHPLWIISPREGVLFSAGWIDDRLSCFMRVIICQCIISWFVLVCVCVYMYLCAISSISHCFISSSYQINAWVASVISRVSGPADYTNGYSCMQSVSFSFVCVSAQQSEEMSVFAEERDEHTLETKRLAKGNTQQASDTKTAVHCRLWVNSANVF